MVRPYAWSPATGLSNTTVASPIASPTQTTLYQVIVTNSNNLAQTAAIDVVVYPNPSASITAVMFARVFLLISQRLCAAHRCYLSLVFWRWRYFRYPIPVHQYANADSFNVVLVVTLGTCSFADTAPILVYPTPVANFEANSLVGYNDSSSPVTFINQSTNADLWQWNFGDQSAGSTVQSPSHVYAQTGTYSVSLIASNQFGCTDSINKPDYISIYPVPKLYIPNVFSPNGDGVNDILLVETTGVKYFNWMIFDRWGEKVFQSEDINTGWDGTYKGQKAVQAVYVYYLKVIFDDGYTTQLSWQCYPASISASFFPFINQPSSTHMGISIRRFEYGSSEYQLSVDLRYRILRDHWV